MAIFSSWSHLFSMTELNGKDKNNNINSNISTRTADVIAEEIPDQPAFSCSHFGWFCGKPGVQAKVEEGWWREGSEWGCSALQSLWEDCGVAFVCRNICVVASCIFVRSTSLLARSGTRHKYIVVKKLISDRGDMSWGECVARSHARVRQEDPGNGA